MFLKIFKFIEISMVDIVMNLDNSFETYFTSMITH